MVQLKQRLNPTEARQGSPRRMNLRVLVGSLVLALLAGLFLYATFISPTPIETGLQQEQRQ